MREEQSDFEAEQAGVSSTGERSIAISGGAQGATIVTGDLVQSAPPTPAPSTPPSPPAHFCGRAAELAGLRQALSTTDATQAITALQGMGGIGKTALAAQLAHELAEAFPGGVFWADLPANGGDPLPILGAWARLCGHDVASQFQPQARAQALRGILAGRMAQRGRLLLVLDDVREAWLEGARCLKKARPAGAPLLLTTRQVRMAQALRAQITRLDILSHEEARALLLALSGEALSRDQAGRVAELCGCLPLALELAAAAAVQEGAAWLLPRLGDAASRLDALALDDARRKDESIRLSFDLSYRALYEGHPESARAFRLLGAFAPAPVHPARLAGVLAGVEGGERPDAGADVARAEAADGDLRRLARWALLRREGERYALHPLLREYAAALLEEAGERAQAGAAHCAHYLAYAEGHQQPCAADYDALEAERANVLAAMERAYREERWAELRRFAWVLCGPVDGYLGLRGYWVELRVRLEQALRAAQAEGERYDTAAFTHNLAILAQNTGDYAEAGRLYRQSLEIKEELGDRAGIASSLHNLGAIAQGAGDYAEAGRLYRQSLGIKEELGDRAGIARSLGQLAILAKVEGDPVEAEQLYRRAIALAGELGDVVGMSIDTFNLALLCEAQGRPEEALELLEQAVEVFARVGSPHVEAVCRVLERVRGEGLNL